MKKINLKICLILSMLLIIILFFSGLNNGKILEKNSELTTIKYTQMKFYDPVFIAKEKGFFKEEGIDLEFVGEMYAGPEMIQAISSGSADMGSTAITALINAKANGFKVIGITDVQTSYNEEPIHKWLTLKENNITTPEDILGKKIAINSLGASFHYTTLEYLRLNNISEKEVEFIIIPHPNMEQALFSGQVDIAGMVKPFSNHALLSDTENVEVLFDTPDVFGSGMQVVTGVVSEEFANENPQAIMSFIKGYNKAIDFIYQNPDEAKEIFEEVLGVEAKYITNQKYQEFTKVDEKSVQRWIKILEDRGDIEVGSVAAEDIITNRFNPFML